MTASRSVRPSATLAIDERVRRRIAEGARIVHLGFGEAGLPVPGFVREQLALGAGANAYGPVAGSAAAREAAAGYHERRGLPTHPDQIVLAPGSKALLFALVSALPGDLLLPRPSWVSYAAQAALAGKRVWWAPAPEEAGGVPDPAALERAVAEARGQGGDPRILVLTLPDNPTGTVAPAQVVRAVAELAAREGIAIVSDEIYRDLAYDPGAVTSPAGLLPDHVYVTSGLSKSMALGGYRIGFARFPDTDAGREVLTAVAGIASEVWSSLAGPMQGVAAYVLAEPPEVVEHVAASRALHRDATEAVHACLAGRGVLCRPPGAAFYLYPDFEPFRERLGVDGGAQLAELLLDRFGIAVLPGEAFGDDPAALRFRLATSLLHGATGVTVDEAMEALGSAVDAIS
ncbi:MAG TPA: aminotransferase class I/II-fold pyridoxal phosphate-dependent enzyme [Gaiellaceae bacterium]|nr:aminotransferase class I/II-fold pyridoxal phosphate-dependent enzyme [Gaiellaceae bacterium]